MALETLLMKGQMTGVLQVMQVLAVAWLYFAVFSFVKNPRKTHTPLPKPANPAEPIRLFTRQSALEAEHKAISVISQTVNRSKTPLWRELPTKLPEGTNQLSLLFSPAPVSA